MAAQNINFPARFLTTFYLIANISGKKQDILNRKMALRGFEDHSSTYTPNVVNFAPQTAQKDRSFDPTNARAAITLGFTPHSSIFCLFSVSLCVRCLDAFIFFIVSP